MEGRPWETVSAILNAEHRAGWGTDSLAKDGQRQWELPSISSHLVSESKDHDMSSDLHNRIKLAVGLRLVSLDGDEVAREAQLGIQ